MSDTPRTDAALCRDHTGVRIVDLLPYGEIVRADFARELERENTALQRRLLRYENDAYYSECDHLRAEVARLRAAMRDAWEMGFKLAVKYGDNHAHFNGEQKERQWTKARDFLNTSLRIEGKIDAIKAMLDAAERSLATEPAPPSPAPLAAAEKLSPSTAQ